MHSTTIQLTNNDPAITTSSFLQLPNNSAPIPHDNHASFMSTFLSQLAVVPTSSFSHFHISMNATNTATGLRIHYDSHQTSLDDVTIAHVSAMAATMSATMTNVFATRNATTKVLQCQLAQAQKTMSQGNLHPTKKATNYATPRYLLLIFVQNDPAIIISSPLLPCNLERPAIMMATHANYSLQLIVTFIKPNANIPLSDLEGAQHAQINLQTFQLIVASHYSKTFLHFSKGFAIFCEGDQDNANNGNNTEDDETVIWQKSNLPLCSLWHQPYQPKRH
jgi:hypothetical protein